MPRIFFKRIIAFVILLAAAAFLYWNYFTCKTEFQGMAPNPARSTVLFDFDGTIADTREELVKILNQVAPEYGFKRISPKDSERFRDVELKEAFQEVGVGALKLPFVVRRVRTEMQPRIQQVKLVTGIKAALRGLKEKGCNVGIVTANTQSAVKNYLEHHGIQEVDFIYSSSCLYGKDKLIKELIKSYGLKSDSLYLVGDELRDVKTARNANIKSIAVTWGFSTQNLLCQIAPDFVAHAPADILRFFK